MKVKLHQTNFLIECIEKLGEFSVSRPLTQLVNTSSNSGKEVGCLLHYILK